MNNSDILKSLLDTDLFSESNSAELESLLPFFEEKQLEDGETVIEECSAERHIYVITSGTLGVYKSSNGCEDGKNNDAELTEHHIATIEAGEVLGEMSFIEQGQLRSASIRAIGQARLLLLSHDAFERFQEQNHRAGFSIMQSLARRVSGRLRNLNTEKVERLETELEETRSRAMMSRMISYIILLLFGYNLTLQLTMNLSKDAFFANVISFGIVAIFGIMLVILARSTGYGWKEYGLTLVGWKKAVVESVLWSLGVMAVLTVVKVILINSVEKYAGLPLFGPFNGTSWLLPALAYSLLSPVQEFIARGVLQSSFERFYSNKNRVFMAILISNALFSAAHVHLSSLFAATVFIPGFLWGYLYHRHRNILGVSISHILIGLYAVYILRFVMMANL